MLFNKYGYGFLIHPLWHITLSLRNRKDQAKAVQILELESPQGDAGVVKGRGDWEQKMLRLHREAQSKTQWLQLGWKLLSRNRIVFFNP